LINRVVIVGSGALATFYAYKWSRDFYVSVLGSWKESISAINLFGQHQSNRKLTANLDWGKTKEPDLVVWLTKTYKNKSSLMNYAKLNWRCPVLILQNGIGQESLFQDFLGENQKIIRGVTNQGAKLMDPGNVLNTGDGEIIVEKDNLFNNFPVVQVNNIQTMVYNKLAISSVLNPTCALFGVSNKNATIGEPGKHLKKMVNLCFPFFKKRKVFDSEKEYLEHVESVARKTGDNLNSMLVDFKSNRKTEVSEILAPINNELKSAELTRIINLLNS
tara:strand:+ start:1777 stop:2601 length:825 start_codon:yes stop_codon:yes gene_type:complete